MAFDFNISPGSGSPIFRQIVDQVRLAAATGRLAPGDLLPSVRALAERLLVNPNTVAKAYGELSRDGIIETQQGRGVFIGFAGCRRCWTRSLMKVCRWALRRRRSSRLWNSVLAG
jgi:DNA-binding transcriptional regulator YhcF (GntR family)